MNSSPLAGAAFAVGRLAQRSGSEPVAVAAYELAGRLAPSRAEWRLRQVRLLQSGDRWERSREAAARYVDHAGSDAPRSGADLELRWRLGLAATATGDHETARRAFASAVAVAGKRTGWRRTLRAALSTFEPARSVHAYAALSELEPKQRRWVIGEARAHERLNAWASAAEAWQRLLALDPSRAPDHYRLGACYVRLGRPDDARTAIRAGLAHDPTRRPLDDLMLKGSPKAFRGRRLIAHFVEDHLDEVRAAVADRAATASASASATARHVFVYWAQGFDAAPPIVRRCVAQLRAVHAPGVVVELDNANLAEWIHVPDDVAAAASRTPTQYSDLVRTALLAEHGGVWLDATCFVTGPVDAVEVEPITRWGLTAFRYRTYRIASWFMRAEPGDPLVVALLELQLRYWRAHDHVVTYFMFHDMLEALCLLDPVFGAEFERSPVVRPTWELTKRMREPYDAEGYAEVLSRSFVHKLTYKQPEANTETGTYFARVLASEPGTTGVATTR